MRGFRFPKLLENAQIQVDSNQENWYKMQTEIEKRALRLLNGILSKWKIFRTLFGVNKVEDKGIQAMVDLIIVKARQGLVIHLKLK